MDIQKVIACARDVNQAEEQASKWMAELKKMVHAFNVANNARNGKDITVGELSTFVLRSGSSTKALSEMLERFTWITPDCAVWAFTKALLDYPEQVQAALIKAAKEAA